VRGVTKGRQVRGDLVEGKDGVRREGHHKKSSGEGGEVEVREKKVDHKPVEVLEEEWKGTVITHYVPERPLNRIRDCLSLLSPIFITLFRFPHEKRQDALPVRQEPLGIQCQRA